MRMIFAGLLTALLAAGALLEAFHHHDSHEDGTAACCGHTCSSHHNGLESPALAVAARPQRWVLPAPRHLIQTLLSKQLFRPPAA